MPSTGTTRTRAKSAAATAEVPADEAQQPEGAAAPVVEGEPVDEKAEQRRAQTSEMIDNLRKIIVERMRGEMNPKFEKLQGQLDDLAALLTALQEAQGDGAAQTLEEDALNDKISYAVEVWLKSMYGEEGTATGATLHERLDGLATALAQHQSDVNQRLQQHTQVVEDALKARHVAELGKASVTGVLRDVVAEQRQAVPGVYAKVHQLMLRIEEIGKGRQYKAESRGDAGNVEYSFRGIDDAMDAVGAGLRAVGLIMRSEVVGAIHEVHSVEKRPGWIQHWATTRLTMRYVFVDPADGSEHAVEGYGVGKDLGDKDGSKASSAAMKYALFQGLCIPVKGMNIDPETDNPTDPGPGETSERSQQRRQEVERQQETAPPAAQEPRTQPAGRSGTESPDELAARALAAARAATDDERLTRILQQAQADGILMAQIEDKPLQLHLVTIRRTLREASGGQGG